MLLISHRLFRISVRLGFLLVVLIDLVPSSLQAWQIPPVPVTKPGQDPPVEHFGAMANTGDTASLKYDPNWTPNANFISRGLLGGTRWVDASTPRYVLTYTMVDGVSEPIDIVIDYRHSLFIRDRLVFPNDPDGPRRDQKHWMFGGARSRIPSLVLETLKITRDMLTRFDQIGFRPHNSKLSLTFRAAGSHDPRYSWNSYQIEIFPDNVSDIEVYRGIIYHESFHAMQHASGLSSAAQIDKSHLWFDEATADYVTHYLFGATLPETHRQAPPTYFWNPLVSGSYYVEWGGETHAYQEYLGAHFLHYYLERIGLTGDDGKGFSKLYHAMLNDSGWALTDQELPSLLEAFAQQQASLSLAEIYGDYVLKHVFEDGNLLKLNAQNPDKDLVWRVITLDESRRKTEQRYFGGNQLTANVEAVNLKAPADKNRRIRINMQKEELEHIRVFCKVASTIRSDGPVFELQHDVEAFVDLPEGSFIYVLKCNGSGSADTPFDPTPFTIEFEQVGGDEPLIKAYEEAVSALEALQLELDATQVNESKEPGKLDVKITASIASDSQRAYAEALRKIRGILRELKCAPRITSDDSWSSPLEGEKGSYRTSEADTYPISMIKTVSIDLVGPAVLVKRLRRTVPLPEAAIDVEVKDIAPPTTLQGRWTGIFTIQAMPGLAGIENEAPIDPEEDPFGAACQAAFRQLKELEGKPLETIVRFEPQRKMGEGSESGIAWFELAIPNQDKQEPKQLRYTYERGVLNLRLAVENQRMTMVGDARWRTKEEGPGAAISATWNAYGQDDEGNEQLIMRGIMRLTNPALK